MVFGAFEKYVFGPRREAQKRAEEAERRADEFDAAVKAWYERLCDAKAREETFDEPIPSVRSDD